MYCTDLNLNLPFLKPEVDITTFTDKRFAKFDIALVNDQILSWFKTLNLTIVSVEIFYNPPGGSLPIHLDYNGDDFIRLNWIFGGAGNQMIWYSPKPGTSPNMYPTVVGTTMIKFSEEDCNELHRQEVIGFPSMIRVGVPHTMINGNNPRWAISITPMLNGRKLTWQQGLKLFGGG